jgi:hypothetical protein
MSYDGRQGNLISFHWIRFFPNHTNTYWGYGILSTDINIYSICKMEGKLLRYFSHDTPREKIQFAKFFYMEELLFRCRTTCLHKTSISGECSGLSSSAATLLKSEEHNNTFPVGSQVHTSAIIKSFIFWDVMPRSGICLPTFFSNVCRRRLHGLVPRI